MNTLENTFVITNVDMYAYELDTAAGKVIEKGSFIFLKNCVKRSHFDYNVTIIIDFKCFKLYGVYHEHFIPLE